MSDVSITKLNNGPFLVKGGAQLQDAEGNVFQVKEQYYLCRCGHSSNQPFCSGAHKAAEYVECSTAIKEKITE
ncbi:MAG TPA: CDGSH iron-sulfur domain-containing protein [Bacilli bacterium]